MTNYYVKLADEVYENGINNIERQRLRFIYTTLIGKLAIDPFDLTGYEVNYIRNTIQEISDERVDHIDIVL